MDPIIICDGCLLNVPSSETLILVISSAAVSDSAVRLRLQRTYGRHDYPSFPSDGCVRDDLYLPLIDFLVPTAGHSMSNRPQLRKLWDCSTFFFFF